MARVIEPGEGESMGLEFSFTFSNSPPLTLTFWAVLVSIIVFILMIAATLSVLAMNKYGIISIYIPKKLRFVCIEYFIPGELEDGVRHNDKIRGRIGSSK